MDCNHERITCLNHYEYFRKYKCDNCDRVVMCECERILAETFLPHQIAQAFEYGTRHRIPVDCFAENICNECRGLPEEEHPRAAIWGQKGKVERFYWREIFKTYCNLLLEHYGGEFPYPSIVEHDHENPELAKQFQKQAKQHWQEQHRNNPKYKLKERTKAEFFAKVSVPITEIQAPYRQVEKGSQKIGKWQTRNGDLVSVEELASLHFAEKGFTVIKCERLLISAWVATFLGVLIQNPHDPRSQLVMRGSTIGWSSQNRNTPIIQFYLPEDFGSEKYYTRRKEVIESWLTAMTVADNLVALFDALLPDTELIRDYLWVAEVHSVEVAREALKVLTKSFVVESVRWAIQDFWSRQPGWPDLLVFNSQEFRFVEIKSPYDKLSQEQMNWFKWAIGEQNVPCEILRVKRQRRNKTS